MARTDDGCKQARTALFTSHCDLYATGAVSGEAGKGAVATKFTVMAPFDASAALSSSSNSYGELAEGTRLKHARHPDTV